MSNEKQWYAVYTRPKWEKKVSELLGKRNVENFCPLNKVIRQWADRKKIVYEPLFSCYVFVHVADAEHVAVRQTDGILNFVHWLGKPAIIRDEEIDALQRFLCEHQTVQLERIRVNVNDKVRVISGPLIAREGSVIEVRSRTIRVLLPSLGYAMVAEVKLGDVEIIPVVNPTQTIIKS